jgi:hypothetical protein
MNQRGGSQGLDVAGALSRSLVVMPESPIRVVAQAIDMLVPIHTA